METTKPETGLDFDYHAIRLVIGGIITLLPWLVMVVAAEFLDSISWSYHTNARDWFVGLLFVVGAMLICYKGHKPTLTRRDVEPFWIWLEQFWNGAVAFRIWEKKHEEDIVGWVGGIAALVTALSPTARCLEPTCPVDQRSQLHALGALILFSTTVYFCLCAFRARAIAKREKSKGSARQSRPDPKQLRAQFYTGCGLGIAVIMVGLVVMKSTQFGGLPGLTFWAEVLALELFGLAWLVASQYLPIVTDESERQRLF